MKKMILGFLTFGVLFFASSAQADVSVLNDTSFDSTISKGVVVVDFYADWCGPCKRLAPTFASLSDQMTDVTFGKVNIDHARGVASKYRVTSIPAIILFKDGKEVNRRVGVMDARALRQFIDTAK